MAKKKRRSAAGTHPSRAIGAGDASAARTLFHPRTFSCTSLTLIILVSFLGGGAVSLLAFRQLSSLTGTVALRPADRAQTGVLVVDSNGRAALSSEAAGSVEDAVSGPPADRSAELDRPTAGAASNLSPDSSMPVKPGADNGATSGQSATSNAAVSEATPPRVSTPARSVDARGRKLADLALLSSSGLGSGVLKRGQAVRTMLEGANLGEVDAQNVVVRAEVQLSVLGGSSPFIVSTRRFPR